MDNLFYRKKNLTLFLPCVWIPSFMVKKSESIRFLGGETKKIMSKFLIKGQRVALRRPTIADKNEFIALMQQSKDLHYPWIFPPDTKEAFKQYLKGRQHKDQDGFLVCHVQTHTIMGVINLSCIVRGWFQSAYLGYYIGAPYAGKGYMKEGMMLAIRYAFSELKLHRLEANIQPQNQPSIALVKSCGFRKEGFSPRYLQVDGKWRDHERWAILADEI